MNLKDFEKDIKETENIIKHYKIHNIRIFFKKNLKKFKVVQKSLIPIYITTALSFPLFKTLGLGYPFIMDNYKEYNYDVTNTKTEEKYEEYSNMKEQCFIKIEKPYYKNGTHYEREVYYYKAQSINDINNLNDLKIINVELEKVDNIDKNNNKISILFYDKIKEQFRVIEEETELNLTSTALLMLILLIVDRIVQRTKLATNPDDIKNIEKEYSYVYKKDIKMYRKKLEMKKKNYELLKGDYNE